MVLRAKDAMLTKALETTAKTTEVALTVAANSTSCCVFNEPKAPAELKKFRKF